MADTIIFTYYSLYPHYSNAQYKVSDGDRNTSNIQVSGRLSIDWNMYLNKKSLLECLNFGAYPLQCNVPDPVALYDSGLDLGFILDQ